MVNICTIYGEQGYLDLVKCIIDKGAIKGSARSNMPMTKSIFGNMLKFDLTQGFPLFTTKKMFTRGLVGELLWFLSGSTDVRKLNALGVKKFWNEDVYNFYVKKCTNIGKTPKSFDQWEQDMQNKDTADLDYSAGRIYGHQWRLFDNSIDQVANIIADIINNPFGRYKVITAWNPADMPYQALPACHMLVQFNCREMEFGDRLDWLYLHDASQYDILKDTPISHIAEVSKTLDALGVPKLWLDCSMTQRSADMMLGVPINIASYSLMTHIIAYLTNCCPGEFTWFGNDCHIYSHHQETALQQCNREPFKECTLKMNVERWKQNSTLNRILENIKKNDFSSVELSHLFSNMAINDFEFVDYKCHDKLEYQLFTGLKQ